MRLQLGKHKKVRRGDLVSIKLRLPSEVKDARLSVWSRVGDYQFSPHVQMATTDIVTNGRPQMVQPMSVRLGEHRKEAEITFVADEAMDVLVQQDVDVRDEPLARARIRSYGAFALKVRRILGNAIGSLRGGASLLVGNKG